MTCLNTLLGQQKLLTPISNVNSDGFISNKHLIMTGTKKNNFPSNLFSGRLGETKLAHDFFGPAFNKHLMC